MKPSEIQALQNNLRKRIKMATKKADTKVEKVEELSKFRQYVKDNKTKIIAIFTAIVSYIAGEFGIVDAIKTFFAL